MGACRIALNPVTGPKYFLGLVWLVAYSQMCPAMQTGKVPCHGVVFHPGDASEPSISLGSIPQKRSRIRDTLLGCSLHKNKAIGNNSYQCVRILIYSVKEYWRLFLSPMHAYWQCKQEIVEYEIARTKRRLVSDHHHKCTIKTTSMMHWRFACSFLHQRLISWSLSSSLRSLSSWLLSSEHQYGVRYLVVRVHH